MWPIALLIGLIIICVVLFRYVFRLITVWEYEKGLRFHRGSYQGIVEAGQYWICTAFTEIFRIDMRPQQVTVPGQEVLSADGIALKVSLVAEYEVTDPHVAFMKAKHRGIDSDRIAKDAYLGFPNVENTCEAVYNTIQLAAREVIGSKPIDELIENRCVFDESLTEKSEETFTELGFKLHWVKVRDIMFPGDLKKVFAKVVQARKEGQAALERARGETAALRNLANSAKLMENNPSLLQLRSIQAIGESSGNTLVLGISAREDLPTWTSREDDPKS